MVKEDYIEGIYLKLCNNVQLETSEIATIISALRESKHCLQKPYYEVIYHDEYDNTEHRVMEPVDSKTYMGDVPGYEVKEDWFDLRFRRLVRKGE